MHKESIDVGQSSDQNSKLLARYPYHKNFLTYLQTGILANIADPDEMPCGISSGSALFTKIKTNLYDRKVS